MSIWILIGILEVSIALNIMFGIKCYKHKNNHKCRELDIKKLLNGFEVEIRQIRKKYNLGK